MHGDVISNVKSTVRWWNDTVQHGVAGLTAAAWSNAFPSLTTTLTAQQQPALAVSGSSSSSSDNTSAGVTATSETANSVTVKSETVSSETANARAAAAVVLTSLPAQMDVSPSTRPPVRRTSTEMMAELNSLVARLAVNKGQRVSATTAIAILTYNKVSVV